MLYLFRERLRDTNHKMRLMRAKGVRDFSPREKIVKEQIVEQIKKIFELYGFSPIETPILERYELLASKYAGGAEILKETFKLRDRGGRKLGLRYDLTVPLARYIGMNPGIKMPFKRYEIGRVFRDGPIRLGRYREFWQCDADIIGVRSVRAEVEIITLTQQLFKKLGLDVVIKINNRKLLDEIMEFVGVERQKREAAMLAIDKLDKLGKSAVEKELLAAKLKREALQKLMDLILIKGTTEQKITKLKSKLGSSHGINELEELFGYIDMSNIDFSPSLARGLAYYTGTIFEVFLKDSDIKSAVAAGGRYDELIGRLVGHGEYPAVGIAFGLEVMMDAVKLKGNFKRKTLTDVYVIPIKTFKEAFSIVSRLRSAGIKADIDLMERSVSRNLDYANAMSIPYVIFVGEKELKKKKVKLRNMISGKEEVLSIKEVIRRFSSKVRS